jgi:DNA-binding XRE family transcriptional regulator
MRSKEGRFTSAASRTDARSIDEAMLTERQTFVAPDGTVMVVLPLAELEEIEDAAEEPGLIRMAEESARKRAAGEEEYIPAEMAERLWAGESRVRVWREHRGLTVSALAKAAGVSQAYLSQIESGVRDGTFKTMAAIARALKLPLDELVPEPRAPRRAAVAEPAQKPFRPARKKR